MITRRDFMLAAGAAAVSGCVGAKCDCACVGGACKAPRGKAQILFGICNGGNLADTQEMKAIGYDFFEGSVASSLKPLASADEWVKVRDATNRAALPIRSCNGFIPGDYKLIGPENTRADALKYAVAACHHADDVNCKYIVFGSGNARRVPDGYDIRKARVEFVDFCKALAERIEDCRVTVVLEPLRAKECNLLHLVTEGLDIVKQVGSPRVQQLADFFHMVSAGEGEAAILAAGDNLKHCHIATPIKRTAPGLAPADFTSFFAALKQIGYRGGVSVEADWGGKDVKRQAVRIRALNIMRAWAAKA